MHTLVVLPTFNEVANIEDVLRRTRSAVPEAEILVVDDGSPDGTGDLAEKVGEDLGAVHVLRRDRRGGLGDAYRSGFEWGLSRGAQVLVEMDSDLSHDPAALPSILARLADCDLVIGSRYTAGGSVPHWAWHRRLLSRAGNVYSAWMLGLDIADVTSGFRAYRADIVHAIDLQTIRADGYGFQIEMAYRAKQAGGEVVEVPIRFVDRTRGESKMSAWIIVEALLLVTRTGLARVWSQITGGGMSRAQVSRLSQ